MAPKQSRSSTPTPAKRAKQIKENITTVIAEGVIHPDLADLGNPVIDETNPIGKDAETLASRMVNPNISETSKRPFMPKPSGKAVVSYEADKVVTDRKILLSLINDAAADLGVTAEKQYIEDIFQMATRLNGLHYTHVLMYLRGVLMCNQISATTGLEKLVISMGDVLNRSHEVISAEKETRSILGEKLALQNTKLDGLISLLQLENDITRNMVKQWILPLEKGKKSLNAQRRWV